MTRERERNADKAGKPQLLQTSIQEQMGQDKDKDDTKCTIVRESENKNEIKLWISGKLSFMLGKKSQISAPSAGLEPATSCGSTEGAKIGGFFPHRRSKMCVLASERKQKCVLPSVLLAEWGLRSFCTQEDWTNFFLENIYIFTSYRLL